MIGITGLSKAVNGAAAGAVIGSTISFMSASISALILIVIGFGIEFSRSNMKAAF